jgi:acylphosphatase
MDLTAKRIIVHGRVQGVGFRYFARHVGTRLGLTGDVRNCPDSTVEIIVEGPAPKVSEFIREMERGPSLAQVRRVEVADIPPRGCYSAFLIEGW